MRAMQLPPTMTGRKGSIVSELMSSQLTIEVPMNCNHGFSILIVSAKIRIIFHTWTKRRLNGAAQ